MRGDIIFQVFGVHAGREEDCYFGSFRTTEEAEAEIQKLGAKVMNGENWAQQYRNKGFVVRPKVVDSDFEIPSRPKPRDKYTLSATAKPNRSGTWHSMHIE